jgi:hypothetical protein
MNFAEIARNAMYGNITSGHPSLGQTDQDLPMFGYESEGFKPTPINKPWNKITADVPEVTKSIQGFYRDLPSVVGQTLSPQRQQVETKRMEALKDVRQIIYKNQGDLQKSAIELMDKANQVPDNRYDEFINQLVPGASEQIDIEFTPRGRAVLAMEDTPLPTQKSVPWTGGGGSKVSGDFGSVGLNASWKPKKDRGNFTKRVEALEEMEIS